MNDSLDSILTKNIDLTGRKIEYEDGNYNLIISALSFFDETEAKKVYEDTAFIKLSLNNNYSSK